jgi:hypothetical protein
MKTATLQIGNSDDKLTQKEWSDYVNEISKTLEYRKIAIHFSGGSVNWAQWQNYAWVIALNEEAISELLSQLCLIRKKYRQDSVAWTEGDTEFI